MDDNTTYQGIGEWYEAEFEKLGWMLLANDEAIHRYKKSIKQLHRGIRHSMKLYNDSDKMNDLKVMKEHTEVLKAFVDDTLSSKSLRMPLTSNDKNKIEEEYKTFLSNANDVMIENKTRELEQDIKNKDKLYLTYTERRDAKNQKNAFDDLMSARERLILFTKMSNEPSLEPPASMSTNTITPTNTTTKKMIK
jgi:hypothetical protein